MKIVCSFFAALFCALVAEAFVGPSMSMTPREKAISCHATAPCNRRDAFFSGIAFLATAATVVSPKPAIAGSLEINNPIPDDEYVPTQQPTGGKVDVNGAFVGDYKQFPGMYPHAAGLIASHGPYAKVSDIYKIEGVNAHDKEMFQKYEKELTALPARRRQFNERINARVST